MTKAYRGGDLLAEVVRSNFVEGFHRGSAVILDAAGAVRASVGDIDSPVFTRSANKPMQTLGALRSGLPFTTPADLALASASHRGEPFHVDAVATMLKRAELTPDDLQCPLDRPVDETARNALIAAGTEPSRLTMNCSGKHAAMLATCRAANWPTESYLAPTHPLQQANAQATTDLTGHTISAVGIDGCGAPLYAYPLIGLAQAFLRLVNAPTGTRERAIADAMRTHPELVSGTHGFDTLAMRTIPGLLAKIGAEGIQALAIPGIGAVAVKIDDGNPRALPPVAVSALRSLDLSTLDVNPEALTKLAASPLLGGGRPVGAIQPVWPQ